MRSDHREQLICLSLAENTCGICQTNALHPPETLAHIKGHDSTQGEEKQVHGNQYDAGRINVLLGRRNILAGKVLLHHFLIQSSHYYGNKDTADKLFDGIVRSTPVPVEPTGIVGIHDSTRHFSKTPVHGPGY